MSIYHLNNILTFINDPAIEGIKWLINEEIIKARKKIASLERTALYATSEEHTKLQKEALEVKGIIAGLSKSISLLDKELIQLKIKEASNDNN